MPRAQYEQDCDQWIRAPLSSRSLLHLACMVSDSSLHVYTDHDLAYHLDEFVRDSDLSSTDRDLTDPTLLSRPKLMMALTSATGHDILIDAGAEAGAATLCQRDSARACAWLLKDTRTGTWMARIFSGPSLTAPRRTVQSHAFNQCAREAGSTSFRSLAAACRRSGISIPCHASREVLLSHIRNMVDLDAEYDESVPRATQG